MQKRGFGIVGNVVYMCTTLIVSISALHILTNWMEFCRGRCTARKLCSDLAHIYVSAAVPWHVPSYWYHRALTQADRVVSVLPHGLKIVLQKRCLLSFARCKVCAVVALPVFATAVLIKPPRRI